MKKSYLVVGFVGLLMIGLMSTSRSDVSSGQTPQVGGDGTGTGPNAHGHRGMGAGGAPTGTVATAPSSFRDPFTLYDSGPPQAAWNYAQLSSGEKAVIDAGEATTQWNQVNTAWAEAVAEHSQAAAAAAAATQLGVNNLGQQGVVP